MDYGFCFLFYFFIFCFLNCEREPQHWVLHFVINRTHIRIELYKYIGEHFRLKLVYKQCMNK